jgi:hypothetical protein
LAYDLHPITIEKQNAKGATMIANRQRLLRRLIGLLLVCMLSTYCVGIDREVGKTTISIDGEYAKPGWKVQGCESPDRIRKDKQIGGTATVRYEPASGFVVEGEAGYAIGEVLSTDFDDSSGRIYHSTCWALGVVTTGSISAPILAS